MSQIKVLAGPCFLLGLVGGSFSLCVCARLCFLQVAHLPENLTCGNSLRPRLRGFALQKEEVLPNQDA